MPDSAPYLAFYGLSREPFADAVEFDLFYAEPRRTQRLDILLHLTQFSDELLLVIGPAGSGKSTLLQQFAARALTSWRVARIEAGEGLDLRDLIEQLHQQFDLGVGGATHAELLEHLQHHLDGLLRNAQQGVLLVDDAHRLSIGALQRLLSLAAERSYTDRPLLRVILFGEHELQEKLAHPQLAAFADLPQRVIDLPPFDEEQTAHYVLHRLSSARFAAGEPFTEAALHKLYRQSGGWPGKINALARQKLLDSLPKPEGPPDLPGISDRDLYRPRRLLALGATLLGVFGLFLWTLFAPSSDGDGQAARQQTLTLPPQAATAPAKAVRPQETPQPRALGEGQTAPHERSGVTGQSEAVLDQPATAATEVATGPVAAAEAKRPLPTPPASPAKPTAAPITDVTPPPARDLPTAAAEPPEEAGKPPVTPATAEASSRQTDTLPDWLPPRRNAWLLARDPQHYTLQLVAGEHLETLQRFLREHSLDADRLAVYQTTRQGRPWYALVYGEYADKAQAQATRQSLPRSLRRLKPWIRDFGSIQHQLRH